MVRLAVVIITYNEERNIERCLKSIQGVADEIIVVDSFSTDKTQEIIQNFDAQLFTKKWEGYSKAKNFGNEQVSAEYILWLDADEALDSTLQRAILTWKHQSHQRAFYTINRLTNYCGKWIKHSGWYPDRKVRLFPKNTMKWNNEVVHESLEEIEHLPTKQLEGDILHFSYYSFNQHRQKADSYSRLTAKKYVEQGKKAHFFQPIFSALGRFVAMYFFKKGFLDGYMGFKIAQISAASNYFKYQEVRRLQKLL
jgi:glycosyltransferase involved in cell wall biosynthesis